MQRVARAAPDGYTIVCGNWTTFVSNGAIMKTAYDVVTDFEPVILLPATPMSSPRERICQQTIWPSWSTG